MRGSDEPRAGGSDASASDQPSTAETSDVRRLSSPLFAMGFVARPRLRLLVGVSEVAAAVAVTAATLHWAASGLSSTLTAAVCGLLAWMGWIAAGDRRAPALAALSVMAAAGGAVTVDWHFGMIFAGVAAAGAAFAFDLPVAVAVTSPAILIFVLVAAVHTHSADGLSTLATVVLLGLVSGGGRRQLFAQGRHLALLETARHRAALARSEADLVGERNRVARDLHDVLGHTLAAVSVQLTALESRIVAGDQTQVLRHRISAIRGLIGDGMDEAREAVRALRGDSPTLRDQLASLCALHGAEYNVRGDVPILRPELNLALYRVAQEALTNAAKHAHQAPVSVGLDFTSEEVELRVQSGAPAAHTSERTMSAREGRGLLGMQERLHLLAGSLDAGPTDTGWLVRARLPTGPATA